MIRRNCFQSCVILRKLRQSNIVPPPPNKMQFEVVIQKIRTNTYERTTVAFICQVHTSHMGCGHLVGRTLY